MMVDKASIKDNSKYNKNMLMSCSVIRILPLDKLVHHEICPYINKGGSAI